MNDWSPEDFWAKIKQPKYIAYSLAVWIELGRKNPRENHYNISEGYNCNTWNVLVSHRVNVDSAEDYFKAQGKEK